MDKLNFPDLEKITAPFGLLDYDTKVRAWASKAAGEKWESLGPVGEWISNPYPIGDHLTYRRAPVPVTQMTVPWHLVPEGYGCAAADKNGDAYAFGAELIGCVWQALTLQINDLPGFDRGTVNWKDSFQRRPGK